VRARTGAVRARTGAVRARTGEDNEGRGQRGVRARKGDRATSRRRGRRRRVAEEDDVKVDTLDVVEDIDEDDGASRLQDWRI